MKSTTSVIIDNLRSGQDQSLYFKEVLPLFTPGNDLFKNYNQRLKQSFTSAFVEGGASGEESLQRWEGISKIINDGLNNHSELLVIEERLLIFYKTFLNPARTEVNQNARAERCYQAIKPHLIGNTVVDFGCGKGLLGARIKSELNKKVYLVDNIDFNKSNLPIILSDREGKTNLLDLSVETSIAYLVLHHMDNPLCGLRELARITQKRIILMEGWIEEIDCRYINQAIDWFFNRILLGVNMNVPLNFLTISQWDILLEQVGFKITKTEYVGADEKLAPEHHVLIIAERI